MTDSVGFIETTNNVSSSNTNDDSFSGGLLKTCKVKETKISMLETTNQMTDLINFQSSVLFKKEDFQYGLIYLIFLSFGILKN